MFLDDLTALARLRVADAHIIKKIDLEATIASLARDKNYSSAMMDRISMESLGDLVSAFLLRNSNPAFLLRNSNPMPRLLRRKLIADPQIKTYYGTPEQNVQIDKTLAMMAHRSFVGDGAAGELVETPLNRLINDVSAIAYTPIAIIGNGAAGIILHAVLIAAGFRAITIYERRNVGLGIWSEKSVYEGSRNNPRNLILLQRSLLAAPGAGDHVVEVLNRMRRSYSSPTMNAVSRVIPGDLFHEIMSDHAPRAFPIVINASGMGLPKPISDPDRMIGPSHHVRAIRWQYPQLAQEANRKHNKTKKRRYVFVGLGNSTAEMLRIVQSMDCDYRVLTHYPREAVLNPSQTVQSRGVSYRMFRDLSVPNLTSYQGDLIHSRQAYYRALIEDKIITDVAEWDATNGDDRKLSVRCHGGLNEEFEFDDLYVLTGYRHTAKSFDSMGISYDEKLMPRYDYDGEFQTDPYREYRGDESEARLHKGYFGFGGVLNAPHNRNAVVIPGMIFRAPDLLFGIIMRAIEYQERKGNLRPKV